MSRPMHFVGSLPPDLCDTPRQAMEWIADQADGHRLTTLPCDIDPNWIVAYLRNLAERPAFEIKRPGEYADYEDMRTYGVRRGHELRPADVSMNRADRLREILAATEHVEGRQPPGQHDRAVQRGARPSSSHEQVASCREPTRMDTAGAIGPASGS